MSTAHKRLLALRSLQLTPMMQGTIGSPQVSGHLGDAFATGLSQPDRHCLNSFVKVRCSFGISLFPFRGVVYSKFGGSTKPGPAHLALGLSSGAGPDERIGRASCRERV